MDLDFGTAGRHRRAAPSPSHFPAASTLDASDMRYDGGAKTWTFTGVTLTLPGTPQATAQ